MRYYEIRTLNERQLDELRMAPSNLKQFLNSPAAEGIRAGFEAEMIFEDLLDDVEADYDNDSEPDYDADESAYDIEGIVDFFSDTESRNRVTNDMRESLQEWMDTELEERWNNEKEDAIRTWVIEHEDVIDSNPGDDDWEEKLAERVEEALLNGHRDNAYESASELFTEDFYGFPPEEQDWLRSMGWRTMHDISEEFGYGWPHWTDPEGAQGDGQFNPEKARGLAADFADWFGVPTKVANYHNATRNDTDWIFESDGSLTPDEDEDMPVEIISPPMPLTKTVGILGEFFNWAKSNKAYANETCGFHMSVSLPNQTSEDIVRGDMPEKKIDFVKLALFLGDQYVLEQFGRESLHFCVSALKKIRANVDGATRAEEAMTEFRKGVMSAASRALANSGGFGKYTSINPKSGYIEFRSAGNADYFKDIPKLENTLMRYAYALNIAGDPNAEKSEYARKMYKLLENVKTQQVQDPKGGRTRTELVQDVNKDSIAAFSRYITGGMSKSELKSFIKQMQLTRDMAKNPPTEKIQWTVHQLRGSGSIKVMAKTAEEAIRMAKQAYQDHTNPDSAYRAEPALNQSDRFPEPEVDDNTDEYVIRRREGDRGVGPILHRFRADGSRAAIEAARQWTTSNGVDRHTVWLDPARAVPPEVLNAIPVRATLGDPRPAFTEPGARTPVQDIGMDIAQNFQEPPASWDSGAPIVTEPQNFPAARSTGGEFRGRWKIVSAATGEVLHVFGGIGNVQSDARRVAAEWARRTGFDDAIEVYPMMEP